MCLCNENWPLFRLYSNIKSMVDNFKVCFPSISNVASSKRLIKWNNNNSSTTFSTLMIVARAPQLKLVVEESYKIMHIFIYQVFARFIQDSYDILYVELYVIYKGLLLTKDLKITDLICYVVLFITLTSLKVLSSNSMFMMF